MTAAAAAAAAKVVGQLGDTTYTKVFVGGLAWETQKDTMKKYFEHFGEILEAVVITDKITGRSKGYGFVTFREADAAMRACVDANPVIDGRRANCNLASLGVQRSTPKHNSIGGGGKNVRVVGDYQAAAAATFASFPHYSIQQGIPYNLYGYSPYSTEYGYRMSYYGMYGGGSAAYPSLYGYGSSSGGYYSYVSLGEGSTGEVAASPYSGSHQQQGHYGGVHYPHNHLFQYYSPHYAVPGLSIAPSTQLQPPAGVTMAMHAPIPQL